MKKGWQRVYSNQQRYRAEIVRAVLDDRGLQPVLLDRQDSSYFFGFCEVHVPELHAAEARKIVEDEIRFE